MARLRRRGFVQLSSLYAASAAIPPLALALAPAGLAGCSSPEPSAPPPTGGLAPAGASPVDASRVVVGDGARAFAADGSSVALSPLGHYVDVFSPSGARVGRLGDPERVGTGAVGTLNAPVAATWDGTRLLVLERGNHRLQAFSLSGEPLGVLAEIASPSDMAFDPVSGHIYVAASTKHRIEVYDANGRLVRTLGRFGVDPPGLNGPVSFDRASDGMLHVVDAGSGSIKVLDQGRYVGQYGGAGSRGDAQLVAPRSIRFDGEGRAWVADPAGAAIRVYDASGAFLTKIEPRMPSGGPAAPTRLALRADGTVYAAVIPAG